MFFAWAHVFFFPFHKPNYYECAFFLAKPTTHARVVRHTILKRNGKKKPWAQTNNSLPNNHVRHNEASFNSTKWRCPYDNVTYCKFTPNRKQLPKQLPPPLHMARTWMDMHRLRRLHDSQYIMKNPFTNENSNLSNIFHNNIHRKKVESLKVRSAEEFLCQFAWLPCRFFRGRRQGRQPLNCARKMVCDKVVCEMCDKVGWERWCVTKLGEKDGVWQSWVWKMVCDKVGVWQSFVRKMVCDKVVCDKVVWERWCVTKLGEKDGVWQSCVRKMVCDKVGCERWCVTKLVCDKVLWERWCVTKLCVTKLCVTKLGEKDGVWQSCVRKMVWQSCVRKMVCDKVVCERWCVWQSGVWSVCGQKRGCGGGGGGGGEIQNQKQEPNTKVWGKHN